MWDMSHELSAETRRALRALGQPRAFRPGDALLRHGEIANVVLLLEAGQAEVVTTSEDGHASVLGYRGPGDIIGEMGVLGNAPRGATVVAVGPVRAVAIPAADFLAEVHDRPDLAAGLLRTLVARLRAADEERAESSSARVRVARALLDLAKHRGTVAADGTSVEIAITQQGLALAAGVGLRTASRELPRLRDQRFLELHRGRITVLDLNGLTKISQQTQNVRR